MLKQIKICQSGDASRRRDPIVHATFYRSRWKPREVPSQKKGNLPDEGPFPSNQNMHPRQPDDLVQDVQERDDITTQTLHPEQVARSPKSMDTSFRSSTRASFPVPVLRKESPSARTVGFNIERDSRHERRWWNQDPLLLPPKHNLTPVIPTTKGRYIQANQVRAWLQSISLWRRDFVTKIEVLRQGHHENWSNETKADATRPPSPSSPFSPSPFSIERKRRATLQSTRTRKIGGKKLLRRRASTFRVLSIYRCRSGTALNSNLNHIYRVGLYSGFFGMSDQPDTIRSCHTISSIIRSRFWSLIFQLSSSVFKEGSECEETFLINPYNIKATPQLLEFRS